MFTICLMNKLAVKIWNVFEMKKMDAYHDLYLKTDVLLLADVLEIYVPRVLRITPMSLFHQSWMNSECNI